MTRAVAIQVLRQMVGHAPPAERTRMIEAIDTLVALLNDATRDR